jgi:hypothetical protein
MNRKLQAIVQFCILGVVSVCLTNTATTEEARDPRLEKILADWQKRQHWFETVEYKVSGVHNVPKGAYNNLPTDISGISPNQVSPPSDVDAPIGFTFLLDFVNGRHRHDNSLEQGLDEKTGKFIPLRKGDTFNGSVMKCLIPKEENPGHNVGKTQPEMSIMSGNMKSGQFLINYYPIFFAHGRIYTAMEPILPGRLRNNPAPEYLYIHGTGVHEGRLCLILRTQTLKQSTTSFDEYWVDTARESAIVRYLTYSGKKVGGSIDIYYAKSHDHWLPESWRYTASPAGKMLYYHQMRVKQITANPSVTDADFEMEVKPGMLVQEIISLPTNNPLEWPKQKVSVYRTKEKGEREEIPDPFRRPGDQYQEHRPRRLIWLWGVSFFVVVSFGIFWIRYRKSALR